MVANKIKDRIFSLNTLAGLLNIKNEAHFIYFCLNKLNQVMKMKQTKLLIRVKGLKML